MLRIQFYSLLLLGLFLVSCAQTEESQRKRWSYNMDRLELVAKEYPNFNNIIEGMISEATDIYEGAASISDEEQRIDRMGEANSILSASFVNGLFTFDEKVEEARKLIKQVMENSPSKDLALVAAEAGMNIERDLNDTRQTLRSSNPTNVVDANRIVNNALKPIEDSITEMKKILQEQKSESSNTESSGESSTN